MGADDAAEHEPIHGPSWDRTVLLLIPPNNVDEVHESVADLWEHNPDLGDMERMRFETALVELAGNVIEHADGQEQLLCRLTLKRTPTSLEAILSDTGSEVQVPFRTTMPDPKELAESGRGIALIEILMDDFSYERDPAGNRWHLVMHLQMPSSKSPASPSGVPTRHSRPKRASQPNLQQSPTQQLTRALARATRDQ